MAVGRRREKDRRLPPRMYLRGRVYYHKSVNTWTRLGADWKTAYAKYCELEGPIESAHTVGQAIDHYLQTVLPAKAEKTQEEYARAATKLRPVFGDCQLAGVAQSDVAQYLRTRSAATAANREVAMLSSVFSEAQRQGWCDINPCYGVRRNTEKPATIIPTDAEINALLLAANPQWRCMLELELLTGARKLDLISIRLQDWSAAGLALTQHKTDVQMLYTRTPELEAAINRCKALRRRVGSFYLFHGRTGKRYSIGGFNAIWKRLKVRAKVRPQVTFHSVRAYVITAAERKYGIDYARRIAGHKSATTTTRYVREKGIVHVEPMCY